MKRAAIFLLAGTLAGAGPAWGATEFEDAVPVELVEIFLGLPQSAAGGLYSDMPDDFPLAEVPEGFTVLGTVDQQYSDSVYLRTALAENEAGARLASLLEERGWLRLPDPRGEPPGTGFTDPRAVGRPLQFCHDANGSLSISSRPAEGGRVMILSRRGAQRQPALGIRGLPPGQESCRQQVESRARSPRAGRPIGGPLAEYMPRMVLPEDADLAGRAPGPTGNFSNSRDGVESETELSIDWELQRVFNYFAATISAQDWSPEDEWLSASSAGGSWTRTANGAELLGVFTVLRKRPGDYLLQFQLIANEPE